MGGEAATQAKSPRPRKVLSRLEVGLELEIEGWEVEVELLVKTGVGDGG